MLTNWILAGITFFYLKDNGEISVLTISSFAGTLISSLSYTFYGANGNNAFLSGLMTLACYIVFAISFGDTVMPYIAKLIESDNENLSKLAKDTIEYGVYYNIDFNNLYDTKDGKVVGVSFPSR